MSDMRRKVLWHVARVWDDGRSEVVVPALTPEQAETRAGRMRDAMTDDECAEGWNYQARRNAMPLIRTPKT